MIVYEIMLVQKGFFKDINERSVRKRSLRIVTFGRTLTETLSFVCTVHSFLPVILSCFVSFCFLHKFDISIEYFTSIVPSLSFCLDSSLFRLNVVSVEGRTGSR